jgi:transposase
MSLHLESLPPIPEETARIARQLYQKTHRYRLLRDELGTIYTDEQFASLYPSSGQSAASPWRLALVLVMQFMENYTDRQAAEAVLSRIDWKYVLSLELSDLGFDASVLSEFRDRIMAGGKEETLLSTLLEQCREHGLLKARGKQRTDSTHVLAAIRTINRLECVGETLRAALNSLATVVPEWIKARAPSEWYDRYEMRMENFRFPKEKSKQEALANEIGKDGWYLLQLVAAEKALGWLREVPAIEVLRRVWVQQFWVQDEHIHWRSNDDIPPAAKLISSPYDPEAHMSIKRSTIWTGYKAHLTETCDDDLPHLVVHVETTPATTQDIEMTDVIHQALERKELLPSEHFMDTGYVDGDHMVQAQTRYHLALLGPVVTDGSWQARDQHAYDLSQFSMDWDQRVVTCPEGKISRKWTIRQETHSPNIPPVIRAQFGKQDCLACPARAQCTTAATNPRQVTFRSQAHHEAIQMARARQQTPEFKEQYAKRSGIEGTISQGVRAFDLRRSRYIGQDKTHLQHIIIATAMNVSRLLAYLIETPIGRTRISRFAALVA